MNNTKRAIELYKAVSAEKKEGPIMPSDKTNPGKAARLMLLLEPDQAAGVLEQLKPEEAEELTRQIANIRRVEAVDARVLLDEFSEYIGEIKARRVNGGVEAARDILSRAFSEEKAEQILNKAVPETRPQPFAFLNDLTSHQLISLMRDEPPDTIALVMAYVTPFLSSRLLKSLPPRERTKVILRMGHTGKILREDVISTEDSLKNKLRITGVDDSEAIDGKAVLADILRCMDPDEEQHLLSELEKADSSLAEQIKMQLYTMELVIEMRDRDLQTLLHNFADRDIAILLKGQPDTVKNKLLGSLSDRRRTLVEDEYELLGAVLKKDAETMVNLFLTKLREGEEEGTFIVFPDKYLS
ncbi:MAG: hypothetical protein B0D92_00845 [Spirochaeta sp. LUC14_002_19_P3]|nr:MAG: hypothetical protein B0D92_00845 [Spirochaeta sp. LUC14_002_19_P3]